MMNRNLIILYESALTPLDACAAVERGYLKLES
jgi:hypothetical protein